MSREKRDALLYEKLPMILVLQGRTDWFSISPEGKKALRLSREGIHIHLLEK
jgi:hypothetical protein